MAKINFLNYVLSGFIGGAIGAIATDFFSDRVDYVESNTVSTSLNTEIESLRREMDSLNVELQSIKARLSSTKPIDIQREPADGFISKKEFEEFAQKINAEESYYPEVLQNQIEETIQEVRRKEQAEKVVAGRQKQVGNVAEWLDLNEAQQELYSDTLVERDAAARDLTERWKAGTITQEQAGVIKRENQTRHLDNVAAILHGDQLETFNRYRSGLDNSGK